MDEGITKGAGAPGESSRPLSILDLRLATFDLRRGFATRKVMPMTRKIRSRGGLEVAGRIQMARPGKIDIDYFLNRGGTIAHGEDAIGELDGFPDIVRGEEDRFLFALPDAHQIGTHFFVRNRL